MLPGAIVASSDGYIGWSEISFSVPGEWTVHASQSADGAALASLEITHRGVNIEIPLSTKQSIRQPHLNDVKLLSVCCDDSVALLIPAFEDAPDGGLIRRTWRIDIKKDKFVRATLGPVEKPGDGF